MYFEKKAQNIPEQESSIEILQMVCIIVQPVDKNFLHLIQSLTLTADGRVLTNQSPEMLN